MVEPWLRGTHGDVDPIQRQVLHALELAGEDMERWCAGIDSEGVHLKLFGVASVAFHLRHMVRSLDRMLTYAEGAGLSEEQLARLRSEAEASDDAAMVMIEVRAGLAAAAERVRGISSVQFSEERVVGRQRLVTTLGGLLVHCAEHTQRHVGQAITTAKVVRAMLDERQRMEGAG